MTAHEEWAEFMASLQNLTRTPAVDVAQHVPTEGELNNVAYLTMKYVAGWPIRQADFAAVRLLAGDINTFGEVKQKFVPALAEYIWDHLMGEPEIPTVAQVQEAAALLADHLYSFDTAARNDIEEEEHGT